MIIKYLALILSILANISLGMFILLKNKKKPTHLAFSAFSFLVAAWGFGILMYIRGTTLEGAYFWSRAYYLAAAPIAYAFLYFSLVFPYESPRLAKRGKLLLFVPNLLIAYMIYRTNWLIYDIVLRPWGYVGKEGYEVILGHWGYLFYTVYFISYVSFAFLNLLRKYKESQGQTRTQIGYILLGTLPAFFFGMLFNLLFPLFGNYRLIWLGPDFSVIILIVMAYAILKHQLMDIQLFINRGLVYTIITATMTALYMGIVLLSTFFFRNLTQYNSILFTTGITFLIVLLYQPFRDKIQNFVDTIFFKGKYDYLRTIKKLSEGIQTTAKLEEIQDLLLDTVVDEMKIAKASLFLLDEKKNQFLKTKEKGVPFSN